jgi:hypothetical protein
VLQPACLRPAVRDGPGPPPEDRERGSALRSCRTRRADPRSRRATTCRRTSARCLSLTPCAPTPRLLARRFDGLSRPGGNLVGPVASVVVAQLVLAPRIRVPTCRTLRHPCPPAVHAAACEHARPPAPPVAGIRDAAARRGPVSGQGEPGPRNARMALSLPFSTRTGVALCVSRAAREGLDASPGTSTLRPRSTANRDNSDRLPGPNLGGSRPARRADDQRRRRRSGHARPGCGSS